MLNKIINPISLKTDSRRDTNFVVTGVNVVMTITCRLQVTTKSASWHLAVFSIIITSGNDLMLTGNKPLPELKMTHIYDLCYCSYHESFSQWQHSFQWKLCSHWLKVVRQRHDIAVVIQGPLLRQLLPTSNLSWTICFKKCSLVPTIGLMSTNVSWCLSGIWSRKSGFRNMNRAKLSNKNNRRKYLKPKENLLGCNSLSQHWKSSVVMMPILLSLVAPEVMGQPPIPVVTSK